ncbi:MAG: hypothetical protein JXA42_14160 [Anaerolineales bacterium]|nr:hypothetical protein [Anaerolineales bacterium]
MTQIVNLPPTTKITCQNIKIGENVQFGPDVRIECEYLSIGNDIHIGCESDADFRAVAGVRIRAHKLELKDGVRIGRCVNIRGGEIHLAESVRIRDWNDINVKRCLEIGAGGTMNEHCEISGVDIHIGRELWMLPYAKIGGGSAFEVQSSLRAGHFVHIGMYCFINTARAVTLGDEVGLGTRTALYTHGAYPSELRGAPVAFGEIHIGDRSWLPGATVNPGVVIGPDCIIGVGSVVTRDIPAGALAAGAPCKVLRENAYPRELSIEQRHEKMINFIHDFSDICSENNRTDLTFDSLGIEFDNDLLIVYCEPLELSILTELRSRKKARLVILTYGDFPDVALAGETLIDLEKRRIEGQACTYSERLLNQLRRYGTRFRFQQVGTQYREWDQE